MGSGAVPINWYEYRRGWEKVDAEVIEESSVTIFVNGQELVTLMASPRDQEQLALGFLKNEGLICEMGEVKDVHVSQSGCCVEVWLSHSIEQPERKIITSGCGGGTTFRDPYATAQPVEDNLTISPGALSNLINQLQQPGSLYSRTRGVHTSGISDGRKILAVAEDVGRHNTLDKIVGFCIQQGIPTKGCILLTTGRISSEMLRKGAQMGCPLIASRNSPTSLSVSLARSWNITLVGYVRNGRMRVYSHPQKVGLAESTPQLPLAGD